MNDINVLQRSPLLHAIANNTIPKARFIVNGNVYNQPYFLADGIYPNWTIFVKSIPDPQEAAKKHFAKRQESCRKDVERAFGVLQKRFAIVRNPARSWSREKLHSIMMTCVILHNMIVEDEAQGAINDLEFDSNQEQSRTRPSQGRRVRPGPGLQLDIVSSADVPDVPEGSIGDLIQRIKSYRDQAAYFKLQADLITHNWNAAANM